MLVSLFIVEDRVLVDDDLVSMYLSITVCLLLNKEVLDEERHQWKYWTPLWISLSSVKKSSTLHAFHNDYLI